MKRIFLLLIGALIGCAVHAQVVEENEPALVYYSPKTLITLDFTYTVETQEKGQYAQYAEDMLGATNAVKENKTTYTLKDVRISTRTETDYSRSHKVVAEKGTPLLLSINEKGLLVGYNAPTATTEKEKRHSSSEARNEKQKGHSAHVAPYPEEVLKAATPLAQAHAVAKQIFHLRETRMYLINGEVEHAPADGEAMRLVMEELDKQEKQLTALFMGKKTKRTDHKIIRFNPAKNAPVLFFSEENGFTDAENIEADSIQVMVATHLQHLTPAPEPDKKSKKKIVAPELSQIVYNLPGNADVKVQFQGRVLGKNTLPVAQFGVDVPLSKELFQGETQPIILFSEKTGNIISISK